MSERTCLGRLVIDVILHEGQRYETVGDWIPITDYLTHVKVSALGDWRMEFLVGIHEAIEWALCKHRGISEEAVTAFDKAHPESAEPGDEPDAPYLAEHQFASKIERILAEALGVDWDAYDKAIESL